MDTSLKNVERKGNWYYYREQVDGERCRVPLCRVDAGEYALHEALGRLLKPKATTINDLLDSFMQHGMDELAANTRTSYLGGAPNIRQAFGPMAPEDITPALVAQYLEQCRVGERAVSGNREMACLSSAFNYGMRNNLCEFNPCRGVRRNKEKPRRRYVRDDEFLLIFNKACPEFQDYLAVLYLAGFRPGEVRDLRREQITPNGIIMEESKTGKQVIVQWSPALQFFVTRATSRCESPYIVTNTSGQQWTQWAVSSQMRRLEAPFRLHDVRAKAESDHSEGLGLLPLYKRQKRIKPVR